MKLILLLLLSLCVATNAFGGTKCVACGLISSLLFESKSSHLKLHDLFATLTFELNLSNVDFLNLNPDSFCAVIKLCSPTCKLFPGSQQWPPTLGPAPVPDPKNKGDDTLSANGMHMLKDVLVELVRSEELPEQIKTDETFFDLAGLLTNILSGGKHSSAVEDAAAVTFPTLQSSHPCAKTNISCLIHRLTENHLPVSDSDGDGFSTKANRGLRGSHWRGADCDDTNVDVYPGRKVSLSGDPTIDHDCNGITGVDNMTGKSYEQLFCDETERRGLIHIGDSATAHFHLPPQWLSKNGWGVTNLIPDALDELDQPACAWGTGYKNLKNCPFAPNKTDGNGSVAERLWRRNACNHRDFQNIGVNGARSTASLPLVDSAARDPTHDHPALVIFSLIGNDVCNGHPGTTHMTKPEVFRQAVKSSLAALDAKLPKGSFVLTVGLVDGRVLFNNMHALQHPIGSTYEDVYSYLNCNDCSPCRGWMNSNATLRNETSAWARSLNTVYEEIVKEEKYNNFELNFFAPDWKGLISQYVASGGKASDVIEPSDGFHPSQKGNELLADQVWNFLEKDFPQSIGDVNPHNDKILAMFPGQGGF